MNYIISEIKQPCSVCGKLTDRIDISTESRVCSSECITIKDKQYTEYMNRVKIAEEYEQLMEQNEIVMLLEKEINNIQNHINSVSVDNKVHAVELCGKIAGLELAINIIKSKIIEKFNI